MKNAILLGDYKAAVWHPLKGVDDIIKSILDDFDITVCEEYPALKLQDLQAYGAVINYIDAWDKRGNADFAGALLGYVAVGGALLTLHGGIIADALPEVEQLIGAAFVTHPEHEVIEYVYAGAHPIMKDVQSFSLDEEPYMFKTDNLAKLHVIMDFIYKGEKYPAAWLRDYGMGKMCYLSPGHESASFANAGFAKLLRRSALWCVGEL